MKPLYIFPILLALVGCNDSKTPQTEQHETEKIEKHPILREYIGTEVTIQFKRNELGLANDSMLGPTSTGRNSSMAIFKGTLKKVSNEGVLISGYYSSGTVREYESWVPMTSILNVITHNTEMKK